MKLEWKSYGDRGLTAKGTKGVYRIVEGTQWILTIQPNFTRGMLQKGKYADRTYAQSAAQDIEDGSEIIKPLQIGLS